MNIQERVDTLKAKHANLESAIEEEIHRPRPDDVAVTAMKREKLKIKDELAELQNGSG